MLEHFHARGAEVRADWLNYYSAALSTLGTVEDLRHLPGSGIDHAALACPDFCLFHIFILYSQGENALARPAWPLAGLFRCFRFRIRWLGGQNRIVVCWRQGASVFEQS
jgi:hypothetical protein